MCSCVCRRNTPVTRRRHVSYTPGPRWPRPHPHPPPDPASRSSAPTSGPTRSARPGRRGGRLPRSASPRPPFCALPGGPETPFDRPFVLLGAAAAATDRVVLTQTVLDVTRRHPTEVAQAVATLDRISGGRAELGLGTGWFEREHDAVGLPLGPPGVRVARPADTLAICRAMFDDDGCVDHAGPCYRARVDTPWAPTPHRPDIVVGASRPVLLRRAAELADRIEILAPTGPAPEREPPLAPDTLATRIEAARRRGRCRPGRRRAPVRPRRAVLGRAGRRPRPAATGRRTRRRVRRRRGAGRARLRPHHRPRRRRRERRLAADRRSRPGHAGRPGYPRFVRHAPRPADPAPLTPLGGGSAGRRGGAAGTDAPWEWHGGLSGVRRVPVVPRARSGPGLMPRAVERTTGLEPATLTLAR
ncbi:MAG TPA: LLM class flavin-dependent oxidoreductase [Acidimicrobiales bacterium]